MNSRPIAIIGAALIIFAALHLGITTARNPILALYISVAACVLAFILFTSGIKKNGLFTNPAHGMLVLLIVIGSAGIPLPQQLLGGIPTGVVRNMALIFIALISVFLLGAQQQRAQGATMFAIWPYVLYFSWSALTLFWSHDKMFGARETANMIYPLAIYHMASFSIGSRIDSARLLRALRLMLTVLAGLSLVASLIFLALLIGYGAWTPGTTRLTDVPFTIHPVISACYIVLELSGRKILPDWKPRWWLIIATIVIVFLTLTRAYILGLFLAIGITFFIRSRSLTIKTFMITLTFSSVFALLLIDNPVKRRMFWQPHQITPETLIDYMATGRFFSEDVIIYSGRLAYWRFLLDRAKIHSSLWIGAGTGSARSFITESRFSDYPHGDFVRVLCDTGYIGLTFFMAIYVTLGILIFRTLHQNKAGPYARIAAMTLLGQMIITIITGSVYDIFHLPYSNLAIAMILISILMSEKRNHETHKFQLNDEL